MVIHNQIFDTFRAEQKEIDKAIKLLERNGKLMNNVINLVHISDSIVMNRVTKNENQKRYDLVKD